MISVVNDFLSDYDTRHGTTAMTSEKMGHMLADKGCKVDVRCIRNIKDEDISGYDAYVVGSWILYFKVSVQTIEFLQRHKDLLIRNVVRHYRVDMAEAQEPDPSAYGSFNEFFTRSLRPEARPIAEAQDAVTCPADEFGSAITF